MDSTSDVAAPIDTEFADNTNQRTPCILVLDGSGSMNEGGRIDQLNAGLKAFEAALKKDKIARLRVQVLVIRLGDQDEVEVLTDWTDAINFNAPPILAQGRTPLGKAVDLALQKLQEQKDRYRANSISYTRPWMFLLSDGVPTDPDWMASAERLRKAIADRKVIAWPIAVAGADTEALAQFNEPNKPVYQLDAAQFEEMFLWVSASMSAVSQSKPGESAQIAYPAMMTVAT